MDNVSVILLKYFKVLYFTNLVCTTKFLKYKSLENFQLYGIIKAAAELPVTQNFYSSNCWGGVDGGGGGGGAHACIIIIVIGLYAWM